MNSPCTTQRQSLKRTNSGHLREVAPTGITGIKKPPVEASAWCYTGTKEDTNFSFAWTIENFGRKMERYKNGECLTSDTFKVEVEGVETAWKLETFPNGKQKVGEDTAGAVSIFLYPANCQALNRPFSFAIGFVNEEQSRVMKGKGDHCFRDNQNGWGWLKLVTHQTLRGQDKLLPEEKLNILCVMKFKGQEETTSGTHKLNKVVKIDDDDDEEIGDDLLDMYNTGDFADVVLVCDQQEFPAHKAILGARSDYFRAAFRHDMKEKQTGKIEIVDVDKETIEDMLIYIYSGRVENLDEKADKLLPAAEKYLIKSLKKKCEQNLCHSLTISNCLDYLVDADRYNAMHLKPLIIKFVVDNCREVVTVEGWKEKLLKFPTIFAEVFDALASQPPSKKARVCPMQVM